jgi:hypothetical protein
MPSKAANLVERMALVEISIIVAYPIHNRLMAAKPPKNLEKELLLLITSAITMAAGTTTQAVKNCCRI